MSRHKCLIYDGDPSEQLPVVVPLLMDGLHQNWRCLYLGSPDAVEMVDEALSQKGIDTDRERSRKALILSSDRSHLVDGKFDPNVMVDGLRATIDEAVHDGFRGLCATGDMRWELGADENFEQLLEYEARLERVFREKPLWGICQYHRGMVPGYTVRDALLAHRSVHLGERLNQDNLFYVPPELLLEAREGKKTSSQFSDQRSAKYADWMYQQIARVLEAERARDLVLRDLERLVSERTAELMVANRQLRAFSYSVSHDLRAPLRAILGFGQALAEDSGGQLDPQGQAYLQRLLGAAHRMGDLIEGMLALGRVVEADMQRVPINLTALAYEIGGELAENDRTRSVELVVAEGLRMVGDPVLMRAAMTNLLGNAWKFTSHRPDPRVEVGRQLGDDGVTTIFVRDNGAGFDSSHAGKLFGMFQRLHRQEDFPGTGVGLATVERIISRHGGRIWAEGCPGEGATFFFSIPDLARPNGSPARS